MKEFIYKKFIVLHEITSDKNSTSMYDSIFTYNFISGLLFG